jgi:hypothetical protein
MKQWVPATRADLRLHAVLTDACPPPPHRARNARRSLQITPALRIVGARLKHICAPVILLAFLTSCATQGDTARTEGTVGGAAVGAAVGAGLGYLVGRNAAGAGIGAAVGAAIGGGVGYAYADSVARRHEALAGRERDLDARITFARGINEDTQQYNIRLAREVAEREQRIARLKAATQNQETAQRELAKEKQALGTRVADANKQLAVAQEELANLKKFRAAQASSSKALDDQIVLLEANLAEMKSTTTALASMNARI